MSDTVKWVLAFLGLSIASILLVINIVLSWSVYDKLQGTQGLEFRIQGLESRIEKIEADIDMSQALALSTTSKASDCLDRVSRVELQLKELQQPIRGSD